MYDQIRSPARMKLFRLTLLLPVVLCACAQSPGTSGDGSDDSLVPLLNRLSWGVNEPLLEHASAIGRDAFIKEQLHPPQQDKLPAEIQAHIDAMQISQLGMADLVRQQEEARRTADAHSDDTEKQNAQRAYQQTMNGLAREASTRALLRDLYAPYQLREQLVWFWMNHFNIFQFKSQARITLADFEEHAIRPHALGHFRDLLRATVRHPAMLSYLDNERNAVRQINENYAREIMELHTMGVGSGYTQQDVQELARILTGMGVNYSGKPPKIPPEKASLLVQDGLFEFNPMRHDSGDKHFLGHTIKGGGITEIDGVVDLIARQPATARFVATRLATYFLGQPPSAGLERQLTRTYLDSDGNIATILGTLFKSQEFAASLDKDFKDPVHYVVSAVRLSYGERSILNAGPMISWLSRMGQPLYGHETPEGYPLDARAWSSSGQMSTRFEIARTIGNNSAGLFKTDATPPVEQPAFPQPAGAFFYTHLERHLSATTRQALAQAGSPQEWNTLYLSSPEMMRR